MRAALDVFARNAERSRVSPRHVGSGLDPIRDPSAPHASRVFRAFAEALADALAEDGYRYVHTRRRLEQKSEGPVRALALYTSHYNLSGVYVSCGFMLQYDSRALEDLRRRHPVTHVLREAPVGVDLRAIVATATPLQWDLAVDDMWSEMVNATVTVFREVGPRWFDGVAEFVRTPTPAGARRSAASRVPAPEIGDFFELLLAERGTEVALGFLAEALTEHDTVVQDFRSAAGHSMRPGTRGARLHVVAARFGLVDEMLALLDARGR